MFWLWTGAVFSVAPPLWKFGRVGNEPVTQFLQGPFKEVYRNLLGKVSSLMERDPQEARRVRVEPEGAMNKEAELIKGPPDYERSAYVSSSGRLDSVLRAQGTVAQTCFTLRPCSLEIDSRARAWEQDSRWEVAGPIALIRRPESSSAG